MRIKELGNQAGSQGAPQAKGQIVEQLAKALREEMERRGHSYRVAAITMGVSSGSVVNWAKGWIGEWPRLRNLEALAEYLGHPLYVILGWVGILTTEQVEMLQTIPGYLEEVERMALSLIPGQGYLQFDEGLALSAVG